MNIAVYNQPSFDTPCIISHELYTLIKHILKQWIPGHFKRALEQGWTDTLAEEKWLKAMRGVKSALFKVKQRLLEAVLVDQKVLRRGNKLRLKSYCIRIALGCYPYTRQRSSKEGRWLKSFCWSSIGWWVSILVGVLLSYVGGLKYLLGYSKWRALSWLILLVS